MVGVGWGGVYFTRAVTPVVTFEAFPGPGYRRLNGNLGCTASQGTDGECSVLSDSKTVESLLCFEGVDARMAGFAVRG